MDQERTYKWIQDRLRDLHSGTLNEVDRARLTELSKDDPFLKDALEGYQSSPDHDHLLRLRTISHRIQTKHRAKRRKLFPSRSQWVVQAAAASLLLLLITWSVIYYLGRDSNQVIASSESDNTVSTDSIVDITSSKQDIDGDIAYEEQLSTEILQEEPGLRANAQSKYEEAKAKDIKRDQKNVPPPTAAQPGAVTILSGEETVNDLELSAPTQNESVTEESRVDESMSDTDLEDRARAKDEGAFANAMSPAMLEQRVTGQIMNSYGQPVTGAFIAIPNSNLVTTSDTYGHFEIIIPGSKTPVEITSSGYRDTLLTVSKGEENVVVVLAPQNAQQDYAVYQKMEVQKAKTTNTYLNTQRFEEYVKTNSVFPIQTQYSSDAHAVTVQFTVNADGRPQKVTTVKSNVAGKFHKEAIRLVENGPLWSCEKAPCNKEYTIYFQ